MLRIKVIQFLLGINEQMIFYPRLGNLYKKNIKTPAPVIVDVGANKGQTIDFFLRLFKDCTIHAFEPNCRLFKKLERKYAGSKNVFLYNKGISDKKGMLLFKESVLDETSTFEELNYDSGYLKMKSRVLGITPRQMIKQTYEVEVTTLSEFLEDRDIKAVDVLKIDTEGHEYKCLLGLFTNTARTSIDYIQLEQHNDDMYSGKIPDEELTALLEKNRFCVFQKVKHGFGDFDEVVYKFREAGQP
jgi:FkbM family methyltransferase